MYKSIFRVILVSGFWVLLTCIQVAIGDDFSITSSSETKPLPEISSDVNVAISTPPNIILIVTDDQWWNTLQYMPTVQAELVNKGVKFTNAFVTTAMCCPSRASILTGRYVHNHNVLTNSAPSGGAVSFDDSSTIATWLRDAGYNTALIGKYLNGYGAISPYIPPGWDYWIAFSTLSYYNQKLNENGVIVSYGSGEADYSTDVLAKKAVDFILNSADQPFFLYFTPFALHTPGTPAPRHSGLFSSAKPPRPPSYNENDVTDKPAWVQSLPLLTSTEQSDIDKEWRRQIESLQAVDDAIDSMIQALQDTNQTNNTVIIFASDNGLLRGEHRWMRKGCGFDEAIRVPFVVYYPGAANVPRQDNRFVLNIDIAPTIAELAGIPVPSNVNGRSIVPLLEQTTSTWRQNFLIEFWPEGPHQNIPEYGGVRNKDWKYIEYITGERELYNLNNDPYELTNVASNKTYSSVVAGLEPQLQQLKATGTGFNPLLISSTPLPQGTQGAAYTAKISVSGGKTPYLWTLVAGALPNGLSLNSITGIVSGTPTAPGNFTFTVRATDDRESWDTAILIVQIAASTTGASCDGFVATIVGTAGNNILTGTSGPDVIHGLGGNDTISGLGDNDRICGGAGTDTINGDDGNDRLFGQGGNDKLNGGNGTDTLNGGDGTDSCNGGSGTDTGTNCEPFTQ